MRRSRLIAAVAFAAFSTLLLAACGGGGNNEDPRHVLDLTFGNPAGIHSGIFDLDAKAQTNGGDSPGSLEVKLGGRFQSRGAGQFPAFDVDASLKGEGGSQTFSGNGGLISTGEGAFVSFQGTDYSVPQQLYDQFVATYAQLQGQRSSNQGGGLLKALNIDVGDWVTDLSNEGTADVDGTKTIHISGKADVSALVDDLKTIAAHSGNAGGTVDPSELDRLKETIKSGDVDVYTGETDKVLRRLQLSFQLEPPSAPGAPDSLDLDFELNLADVNKPQAIQGPPNAQPLQVLLQRYGIDVGSLGNSLRGGLGTSGALPESGGPTKAPTPSATQAYQQCLSQAAGQAAIQKCADLLSQ
jgi:hypothetical protein